MTLLGAGNRPDLFAACCRIVRDDLAARRQRLHDDENRAVCVLYPRGERVSNVVPLRKKAPEPLDRLGA